MFVNQDKLEKHISIGVLAELTGITTHTLRVWEKRYGTPISRRLPSGHRRYPKEDVPRLRAIAKALEAGYRASKVVTGTLEELQNLMGVTPFIKSSSDLDLLGRVQLQSKEMVIEGLVKGVHDYDDDYIFNKLHEEWGRDGALSFITKFAGPFLERIGKGWESNELTISNEHFASECMVSFLSEKWRLMNTRKNGSGVLITSLPGEPYSLGILMCAVVTAVTNSKVIYLGNNNPIEEIIDCAQSNSPKVITLSISHAISTGYAEKMLLKIKKEVNKKTLLVTGGKGIPCTVPGISFISDFQKYYNFLIELNNQK